MTERQERPVVIRPARSGRPSTHERVYKPDELVRFDARIPARIAQRLHEAAYETGRPVTAVHADLLAKALDDVDGAAMGRPESAQDAENAKRAQELSLLNPVASLQRADTRCTQTRRVPLGVLLCLQQVQTAILELASSTRAPATRRNRMKRIARSPQ